MIRIAQVRDLLDAALGILGAGAGRVELVSGRRRVRVGRLMGVSEPGMDPPEKRVVPPGGPVSVMVRTPALGVVSFQDNRTGRPLVEVGQQIRRGQTVAFISALDITTKAVSPADGVVEEVFVEDGDGVEFDAPLLRILPGA